MSAWPAVVAALGASGITGGLGFGGLIYQQRRARGDDLVARKAVAYEALITHSVALTIQAGAAHEIAHRKSGLGYSFGVLLHTERPIEPFQLHDWLSAGFAPLNEAWTTVQVFGSPEARKVSDALVDACADLYAVTGRVSTPPLWNSIFGAWSSAKQKHEFEAAKLVVLERHKEFKALARSEIGAESTRHG